MAGGRQPGAWTGPRSVAVEQSCALSVAKRRKVRLPGAPHPRPAVTLSDMGGRQITRAAAVLDARLGAALATNHHP
jgi:hypothetical protein